MINIKAYQKKLKIITQKVTENLKIKLILYKKIKYLVISDEMLISEYNNFFETMKSITNKLQLVSKNTLYLTWDQKQNTPYKQSKSSLLSYFDFKDMNLDRTLFTYWILSIVSK